jgi:hypothetical protein
MERDLWLRTRRVRSNGQQTLLTVRLAILLIATACVLGFSAAMLQASSPTLPAWATSWLPRGIDLQPSDPTPTPT